MDGDQTGSRLIHIVDGTRKALPRDVKWSRHNRRPPEEWDERDLEGTGTNVLV
jgi:hypothetical protein